MRWLDCITMQWTWNWANSRRLWGTGRPGVLQSMGSQRVRHDWVTEQQQELRSLAWAYVLRSFKYHIGEVRKWKTYRWGKKTKNKTVTKTLWSSISPFSHSSEKITVIKYIAQEDFWEIMNTYADVLRAVWLNHLNYNKQLILKQCRDQEHQALLMV